MVSSDSSGRKRRTTTSWEPIEMKRVYTRSIRSQPPLMNRSVTRAATATASSKVGFSEKPSNEASIG